MEATIFSSQETHHLGSFEISDWNAGKFLGVHHFIFTKSVLSA